MHTIRRKLLLLGVAITLTSASLWGQTSAPRRELDLAVTYATQRSNLTPGQFFWRQGGTAEVTDAVYRGLGVTLNVDGSQATNILGTGVNLDTITTTAGPRYTWRYQRLAVFGEGLFGQSHAWNSLFPETGGTVSSYTTFAVQVGGGVDLRTSKHFAVRPIQADWIRTEFPNATTGVQNNLRLSAGIVLRR